jgi:hypothetical protein
MAQTTWLLWRRIAHVGWDGDGEVDYLLAFGRWGVEGSRGRGDEGEAIRWPEMDSKEVSLAFSPERLVSPALPSIKTQGNSC